MRALKQQVNREPVKVVNVTTQAHEGIETFTAL